MPSRLMNASIERNVEAETHAGARAELGHAARELYLWKRLLKPVPRLRPARTDERGRVLFSREFFALGIF